MTLLVDMPFIDPLLAKAMKINSSMNVDMTKNCCAPAYAIEKRVYYHHLLIPELLSVSPASLESLTGRNSPLECDVLKDDWEICTCW